MRRLLLVTLCIATAACAGSNDGADAAATADGRPTADALPAGPDAFASGLPCDVDAVVRARCQVCHGNPLRSAAPMALVTWLDTQAQAPGGTLKVWEAMKVMVSTDSMPPPSAGPLTTDEKRVLMAWLDAGAPRGTTACAAPAPTAPAR